MKKEITIADTLRDIADESSLTPGESYSLRQIANKVDSLLRARKKVLEVFDLHWDDEREPSGTKSSKARNKVVGAYRALKCALD